ncbi:Intermediate filament tail domain-containing protein [Desmophyllum pertusum]|uniref:Intermediate filament tail domain-containing protein n=1 Tax=Desmophyllum pertusum TaxID=174260 RepID=A0A9X0D302_9CNID|nr:Intermediate filament tail domain-containing protein [Desmophyllum pertusum]
MTSRSSPILVPRYMEKDYLQSLNDRFASYVSRVRQMREQSGRMESVNLVNTTKILEDEIVALKGMYERQLEELRNKLEDMARERTQHQLAAAKNSALVAELQDKLAEETSARKKTENALADAHRVIADKEALLQDARVTTTQHQNAHMDTKRDRDGLQSALTQTQQALDVEVAARADLQTLANQLKEKLNFQQLLHEKELHEMRCRLDEAERTILLAEERLHEHNIIDENLSSMLAKVKLNSEAELRRFKEEAELSYHNGMNQFRVQLDNESRNLASATDDNIHLKAHVEALHSKNINLEAKFGSTKCWLDSILEMERQQASNSIKNLEAKLRELQEALMAKVRELGLAYNAHLPLDLELDSFATLLEAEERRLSLAMECKLPLTPVRSRTWHATPTEKIVTPASIKRPATTLGIMHPPVVTSTAVIRRPVTRPKTTSGTLAGSKIKPVVQPVTTASPYRHTWSYVPNFVDYHSPTSSHTGNVRILEVNPDGNYVRVFNTSSFKDEEVGGYMIQQNVAGRPVTVFRFPPRTRLKALSHATVWSAASLSRHNPPSDFLWKDQHKWGTGPECTTILCKPNGQAVAWTTAAYPFGVPNQIPTRETGPFVLQESGLDREPVKEKTSPRSPRSKVPDPVPREIEGKPFSNSPTDPLHPHTVQPRTKTGGHDAMSMHPQARSQSERPDPSGASRTGGAPLRRFTGTSLPNSKSSIPKNGQGGSIRVLPATDFSSPSQKHQDRLTQINSQQTVEFAPPMPRPYVIAHTW